MDFLPMNGLIRLLISTRVSMLAGPSSTRSYPIVDAEMT